MTTPCDECELVEPRVAFAACPHGDLDDPLDFVMVGLNPELPGYRTICPACGDAATFRDFTDAKNRCRGCSDPTVHFWIPDSYEEWRADGAAGDVRGFANRRVDLARIEAALGRRVNFANARYSPWPSVNDDTIAFGPKVGGHLLDFLQAARPRCVLVYSTVPWRFLQSTIVPDAVSSRTTFVTSGGRRHWGEAFGITTARWQGITWELAGVAISQAQDANYATAAGKTRREWVADRLAGAIVAPGLF